MILASENSHKKEEFLHLFPGVNLVTPHERGIAFAPEETGGSFLENALIKAKALWEILGEPVLADDSGICVDILKGKPGIFSARYGGDVTKLSTKPHILRKSPALSQDEKNALLIDETNRAAAAYASGKMPLPSGMVPKNVRSCRFVCSLVFFINPYRFLTAQETLEGFLAESIADAAGTHGFGYDPIVRVAGDFRCRTVAELSPEEKNIFSHRGRAARSLLGALKAAGIPDFL
jgi:XTP/dITP diphosphohydrolase